MIGCGRSFVEQVLACHMDQRRLDGFVGWSAVIARNATFLMVDKFVGIAFMMSRSHRQLHCREIRVSPLDAV